MNREQGFTLIEIIATLVIIGIIAAVAGMGFMKSVESFLFARENVETAQKAGVALNRISMELINCNGITSASSGSIKYSTTLDELANPRTLSLNTNTIQLNNNLLIDRIGAYGQESFLSYRKYDDTPWDSDNDEFSELAAIDIVLIVKRESDEIDDLHFKTTVTIRNNDVANAPLPGN